MLDLSRDGAGTGSSADAGASAAHAPRRGASGLAAFRRRRASLIAAAALVLAGSTWWSHVQPSYPDAFSRPATLSLDWWLYPIEAGAWHRLPAVSGDLYDVCAIDGTDVVWVVGADRTALRTLDAGRTWERIELPPSPTTVSPPSGDGPKPAAKFASALTGDPIDDLKALSEPGVQLAQQALPPMAGPDDSYTFEDPYAAPRRAFARGPTLDASDFALVAFHDERSGWIAEASGIVWRTGDGGQTWTPDDPWLPDVPLVKRLPLELQALGPTDAAFLSRGGVLFVTGDDGVTWFELELGIAQMHFLNADDAFTVESDGITRLEEQGRIQISAGYAAPPFDPWSLAVFEFSNDQHGLAIESASIPGSRARCFETTDGADTWSEILEPSPPLRSARTSRLFERAAAGDGVSSARLDDDGGTVLWEVGTSGATRSLPEWRLRTVRGGPRWSRQVGPFPVRQWSGRGTVIAGTRPLTQVQMLDRDDGWSLVAVDGRATPASTSDGGRHWATVELGAGARCISAVSADVAWCVNGEGRVLTTSDRGRTWTDVSERFGDRVLVRDVSFLAGTPCGYALGSEAPSSPANREHGQVLLELTTILATEDGGTTWDERHASSADDVEPAVVVLSDGVQSRAFAHQDSETAIVLGTEDLKIERVDGGAIVSARGASLFRAESFGSEGGEVVFGPAARDGFDDAAPASAPPADAITGLAFAEDGVRGYATLRDGTLLVSDDAGRSWEPLLEQPEFTFADVCTVGNDLVWMSRVAKDPARAASSGLLRSADRGRTWEDMSAYGFAPAPWYYLSWLVAIGLLVPALRKPRPIDLGRRSVADVAASDRPLQLGDPDPLRFQEVADGLSRFLRNEATTAPLTIAVTGEWGSGKSSLMNLLRADLQGRGFRPVWFNAWHHQKEEHLLASLLQSVRDQSVPAWYTAAGLAFRARLLRARARRVWGWAVLAVFVIGLAAGYFSHETRAKLETVLATVSDDADPAMDSLLPHGSALALLVGLVSVGGWLVKGLRAFGGSPARLMASMSSARVRDLDDRISFRQRFQQEFGEVTRALGDRTLVVLIDDLDRCRPRSVLEVLEAVNFLSSSGECFIVMGMDLERVERCVAVGFEGVAEELVDLAESRRVAQEIDAQDAARLLADDLARAREQRRVFAAEYMEKLVNIEVPVPRPTVAQSARLVAGDDDSETSSTPARAWRLASRLRALAPHARAVALVLLLATSLWVSFAIGADRLDWIGLGGEIVADAASSAPRAAVAETLAPDATPRTSPAGAPLGSTADEADTDDASAAGDLGAPEPGAAADDAPATFTPGHAPPRRGERFLLVVVLAVGAAYWWSRRHKPEVVVQDSEDFREALFLWHPLVVSRRHTPRTIKRFVNRVRFYAMRQRQTDDEDAATVTDATTDIVDAATDAAAVKDAAGQSAATATDAAGRSDAGPAPTLDRTTATPSTATTTLSTPTPCTGTATRTNADAHAGHAAEPDFPRIPEDLLVALAAIQHARPAWFRRRDDGPFDDFHRFLQRADLPALLGVDKPEPDRNRAERRRAAAFEALRRFRSIKRYRAAFAALSAGVRVGGVSRTLGSREHRAESG